MASIDSLPADQRAVLELVLRRGRSYDEIARLLSIDRAGVRQRALAAFDALGPKTRVPSNRRALIADYLLSALPNGVADEVRTHLSASASERAWARAVASELEGLSERPLPEIPANGRGPTGGERNKTGRRTKAKATGTSPKRAPVAEVPASAALSNGTVREKPAQAISRRGGAVLLVGLAAVAIVLVLVLVVFNGGSTHRAARHAAGRTAGRSHTTASSSSPKLLGRITLAAVNGGKSPLGLAYVVSVQNQIGLLVAAQGLPPNSKHPVNYYALWLYNSRSDSHLLGLVTPAVGKSKAFKVPALLPTNAAHYKALLVTLETTGTPKSPGRVVLAGTGTL